MPNLIIDQFGTWDDLGIVQPIFEQWVEFPDYSESLSETIKLSFSGELEQLKSFAYIRCIYVILNQVIKGQWWRIYPKFEQEIIIYPVPEEFKFSLRPVQRFFEIQKRHYYRYRVGISNDKIWTINLQVLNNNPFSPPLPEESQGFLIDLF